MFQVCLEAKKRCSPLMQQYGFKWPVTLSCEQLPRISEQQTTGNICAAPPDTPDPSIFDPTDVSAETENSFWLSESGDGRGGNEYQITFICSQFHLTNSPPLLNVVERINQITICICTIYIF